MNSFYACLQFPLEVFTGEDIVVGESLGPPIGIAIAVVRALERLTAGLVGAVVVIPRREVQPLAAATPLSANLSQVAALGKGNQFVGRIPLRIALALLSL